MEKTPDLYLSSYTDHTGRRVHVVIRQAMPQMAVTPDLETALEIYRRHQQDMWHWHEGQRRYHAPEAPQVYEGDSGEWITLDQLGQLQA